MLKLQITICSLVLAAALVNLVEAAPKPDEDEVPELNNNIELLPFGNKLVTGIQQLVTGLEPAPKNGIDIVALIIEACTKIFEDFKAEGEQILKKILEALFPALVV